VLRGRIPSIVVPTASSRQRSEERIDDLVKSCRFREFIYLLASVGQTPSGHRVYVPDYLFEFCWDMSSQDSNRKQCEI